jgi:threonine synthase
MGWFDCSTLKEPYRLEGKKTMGLELALQFDWKLPDVVLYPTGGGTGLIGMWKAWDELAALGWLDDARRPRMVACQSDGCAPIVRAFERGERHAEPFPNPRTTASGLRVPQAVGDFLILDAVRASRGLARAGDERRIREWMAAAARDEGLSLCPESAVCLDVLEQLARERWIDPGERVVVFNTGAAQKYGELLGAEDAPLLPLDRPIDWAALV